MHANPSRLRVLTTATLLACGLALGGCGASESTYEPVFDDAVIVTADGHFVQHHDGTLIPLMDQRMLDEATASYRDPEQQPLATDADAPELEESRSAPPTFSLAAYQTPIKNQRDRRTCWIFATVAAIEAKYKRDRGITLDLSEQYFNHVAKSSVVNFPRIYKYENQTSYWDGGNTWVVQEAKNVLIPNESAAPYKDGTQMDAIRRAIPAAGALTWSGDPATNPTTQAQVDAFEYSPLYIPMEARNTAQYGVSSYQQFNADQARDTARLETLISTNHEVAIDVDIKWRLDTATGIYEYDPTSEGGAHAILLIGYDRGGGWFLVKNSWGDSGYLKVSYEFFRNCATSAAVVNAVLDPATPPQNKAKWLGVWQQDHDGWKGKLVVRRFTPTTNAAVRLGTYYEASGASHTVNGISLDSDHGLRFFVPPEAENAPGTLSGQKFEVDQYTYSNGNAAGTTWFGRDGEAGVYLGRTAINAPYSNTFAANEWVGHWRMMHDGWNGTLRITAVTATTGDFRLTGSYLEGSGVVRTLSGTLERARPGIAHFTIAFPAGVQPFTLHYHFWDDNLASGSTTQYGVRFGAHAVKL